jgi:hypothetical protein
VTLKIPNLEAVSPEEFMFLLTFGETCKQIYQKLTCSKNKPRFNGVLWSSIGIEKTVIMYPIPKQLKREVNDS